MYFRYFVVFSPLEKSEQIWIPFNQQSCTCAKFGWNWPCGSGEEDENVKFTDGRKTDGRTDDQQSSLRLSAQVS